MREQVYKIYKFDELTDSAKEKAREWYRKDLDFDGAGDIKDDAKEVASLFGLEIDEIYYSGFYSQGDGACFTGRYEYKKGALKAVKAEYPNDIDLHKIVERLQYEQARYFFAVTAQIDHRGHYYRSGCMSIDIEHCYNRYQNVDKFDTDLFRNFADWIYKRLEMEWDYQNSDEAVDESITCNEYEFYENGDIV